jgi:hypothetical protein
MIQLNIFTIVRRNGARIRYIDERVWPHMFPSTLDEIPSKWYKIEEACGHMLNWSDIKEKFIEDFKFNPEEEHLREATHQIKSFLEKPDSNYTKRKREDDGRSQIDIDLQPHFDRK